MRPQVRFPVLLKWIFCSSIIIVLSFGIPNSLPQVNAGGPAPLKSQAVQAAPPRGLGPEFQISDTYLTGIGVDHYLPDTAYNSIRKEFLVVWHQVVASNPAIRNIYAQRVSLDGLLIGSTIQVSNGDTDARPAVAFDFFNDHYLVVWQHEVPGSGGQNQIWGRLISWDGSGLGSSFLIFTWPNRSLETPKVGFDSGYPHNAFLVIWNAFSINTPNPIPTDISGVHVSLDGIPDPSAHNFALNNWTIPIGSYFVTLYAPQQADLVYRSDGDQIFIVYQGYEDYSPDWEVLGQLAYTDGSLFNYWFYLGALYYSDKGQNPAISTGGSYGYLAAWSQKITPGNYVTVVQMYEQLGQKVGAPVLKDEQFGSQIYPAVAGNPHGKFLVARQVDFGLLGQQIWAFQCYASPGGPHCSDSFPVEDIAYWDGKHPAIANGGPDYNTFLIAYEETAPGDPSVHQRIFGRILSAYEWNFLPVIKR